MPPNFKKKKEDNYLTNLSICRSLIYIRIDTYAAHHQAHYHHFPILNLIMQWNEATVCMVVEATVPVLQRDRSGDCGPNRRHGVPGRRQPPGGVWKDDSSTHRAGAAIMAYTHPEVYKQFVRANTIAFVSSLISIFLFTTGLSSITHTMWVSLASIAVSFGASVIAITPNTQT